MFTFDQTVRETEKNTQKDVLFLWRRIGDSERLPFRMQEIDADLAFGSSNHSIIAVKTKRPFRGASLYSGG
jgi:hypothetical protein